MTGVANWGKRKIKNGSFFYNIVEAGSWIRALLAWVFGQKLLSRGQPDVGHVVVYHFATPLRFDSFVVRLLWGIFWLLILKMQFILCNVCTLFFGDNTKNILVLISVLIEFLDRCLASR